VGIRCPVVGPQVEELSRAVGDASVDEERISRLPLSVISKALDYTDSTDSHKPYGRL